jgi:hypothetical protein
MDRPLSYAPYNKTTKDPADPTLVANRHAPLVGAHTHGAAGGKARGAAAPPALDAALLSCCAAARTALAAMRHGCTCPSLLCAALTAGPPFNP